MNTQIGDRVGVLCDADDKKVRIFGYGVYDGMLPVPDGPLKGITNPRMTLDNGDIYWGYEVWWGPEGKIKEMIGDRKVVIVTRDDI